MIQQAKIPRPIQVVIDDVGWWSGTNGSANNEPFRTAMGRSHVPADYLAIALLANQLGIRPQAAMVLCEWDRVNYLRRVPSATWQGAQWDNQKHVGPWLEEAADIVRQGLFEIAVHGVGHEYWQDGKMRRTEWQDHETGKMRAPADVRAHLDAFMIIMQQHNLGFPPSSFVPTAGAHTFATDDDGVEGILRPYGIRHVTTPFQSMTVGNSKPENRLFGVSNQVMTVDRQDDIAPWDAVDVTPKGDIQGPILGLHWPNILHADPARNEETVSRWATFIRQFDHRLDRMLAPNTEYAWSQLAYSEHATVQVADTLVTLNLARLQNLPAHIVGDVFTVKVELGRGGGELSVDNAQLISSIRDFENGHQVLKLSAPRGVGQVYIYTT